MDLAVIMDAERIKQIFITPVTHTEKKPAQKSLSEIRDEVDWVVLNNDSLKFVFDKFTLDGSDDFAAEVLFEIQQRMARGVWLDLEKPPPPLHELPWLLTIFPLNLLHKQRKIQWGR